MAVAKKCHDEVLKKNDQFITSMKAVDKRCSEAPARPLDAAVRSLRKPSKMRAKWLML